MSNSGNTEELGIRLRADGVPETTNGLALTGQAMEGLGKKADAAAPPLARVGKTAKETQAAMRLLPAQITDVVTSLASGQPAWLVAIQQGGQIKDSFGGIGPAFQAVTGAMTPMTAGLTGVAVAVGTLLLAHQQGQREAQGYARAVVLSGNAAGTSANQLADVADRTDRLAGTQAQAARSATALAASNLVAARDLEKFTLVAVRLERTLDQSAETTAKTFADLGKAPLEASVKLNESTNYLTASVYEQIRALQEQGRMSEAASLAQNTYADAMKPRLDDLDSRLGLVQRGWRGVKDVAAEAWDTMLGIGRSKTPAQSLEQFEEGLAAIRNRRSTNPALAAQREAALLAQRAAANRSILNDVERGAGDAAAAMAARDYIKAREANDRWTEAALSNAQKRDQALDKYRKNNETLARGGAVLDPAQVAREEAAIRAQFADPKRTPGAQTEQPYRALNDEVSRRIALADAELTAGSKLSEADRVRIELMSRLEETSRRSNTAQMAGDAMMIDYAAERVRLVEQQRQAQLAQAEAEKKAEQERAAATQTAQREVLTLQQQRQALENETAEIGLNARAIFERRQIMEESTIRTLEDKLARIEAMPAYAAEAEALREQIRLRRQMNGLRVEKFEKNEQQQAEEDAKRRTETMSRSIEDGLVNGFREGRGVADIFMRELKAQAARTLLKFPIQMMAQSGSDLIGKLLGMFVSGMTMDAGGYGITNDSTGSLVSNGLGGGRAFGGGTKSGTMYLVNERGPELLSTGGKTFLMMGANDGYVTPNGGAAPASGGSRTVNLSFSPVVNIDSRTDRAEVAALVSRSLESSKAELLEMMDRGMV